MELKLESPKEWLRELLVWIEPEEVAAAEEEAVHRYQKAAQVPGFRAGRAPEDLVKRRFRGAIRKEAEDQLVREAYEAGLARYDLKPITPGTIREFSSDGHGLRFKISFEVVPQFQLMDYRRIRLKRPTPPPPERVVDRRLEEIREGMAVFIPVERPAHPGDFVLLDYAMIEGSGQHQESGVLVQVGDPLNLPEINQALQGVIPGQELSLNLRPEGEGSQPPEVEYKFRIRGVRERRLPEIDDNLARSLGFEDLDRLRSELISEAGAEEAEFMAQELRRRLYDQLIDSHRFTPPPSLVALIYRQFLIQNRLKDSEELQAKLLPLAERRAKLDLILERIAQKEEIEASQEEVNHRIASYAKRLGMDSAELWEGFYRLRQLQAVKEEVLKEKVTAWLLEQAIVEG